METESTQDILKRRKEIEQELMDMLKETESDFTLDHVRDAIYNEEENDDMMKVVAIGTVHGVPQDFRMIILSDPTVRATWEDLTPLARNEWICWVVCAGRVAGSVVRIVEIMPAYARH